MPRSELTLHEFVWEHVNACLSRMPWYECCTTTAPDNRHPPCNIHIEAKDPNNGTGKHRQNIHQGINTHLWRMVIHSDCVSMHLGHCKALSCQDGNDSLQLDMHPNNDSPFLGQLPSTSQTSPRSLPEAMHF